MTIDTVKAISRLAGNGMAIEAITDVTDIPSHPGVYVMNEFAPSGGIADADFVLDPVLLSGIADSAHAVVGGRIAVRYNDGVPPKELEVAAKCFYKRDPEDRFRRAITEAQIMGEMEAKGMMAYRPVAVAVAPDTGRFSREVILATEYDPSILTLDNMPWGRGLNPRNIGTAQRAVCTLAVFNRMGYVHGDAKIKNVAQNEAGNRMNMIDYETTTRLDLGNPTEIAHAVHIDLGMLFDSLIKKGVTRHAGVSPGMRFFENLVGTYLETWNDADLNTQSAVLNAGTEALRSLF
jgi:hypothetical protein